MTSQQQIKKLSDERDISSLKELPACHLLFINWSAYLFLSVSLGWVERVKTTEKASHRMDAREETLNILNRIWLKLQGLPDATPVELGAFFVLLIFMLVVLLMIVLTCVTCCCCCCRKTKPKELDI